ncbi:sigma factor-like helix-turn-helix DNA-binding protein [Streptomyces sp. LN704]|uniref:sigma factor-like helix-turn-helix DNA-binding protein n=1 Tax=Streptomyces sp. LN704 TaxID=3112982 RepID=UPI00371E4BC9
MSVPNQQTAEALRPAAVYRLFAEDGTLLYIGSAYDPKVRAKKHREKPWWPQVVRQEHEWHPTREAAYVAETEAIEQARPPGNRISGPGAVASPAPKPRARLEADPLFVLAELDVFFASLETEPPAVRFRKLTEMMETMEAAYRSERKRLFQQMHADGMTYREIAKEMGISFGRVRQILAEELDPPSDTEESG